MIYQKIDLNKEYPSLEGGATLTAICHDDKEGFPELRYPAMIICPGGGYEYVSAREAEPVALTFMAKGIQCFVLDYTCAPARYPTQHIQLAAAFAYVRTHAEEHRIDKNAIGVLGFSAGGHLAGTYAAGLWRTGGYEKVLGVDVQTLRPSAMALIYGVLTTGEYTHKDSLKALLGNDTQKAKSLSIENIIGEYTPRAYLCHACGDESVPVMNSIICAQALAKQGIHFEMHIHPEGNHGFALANRFSENTPGHIVPASVGVWPDECANWFLGITGYPLFGKNA